MRVFLMGDISFGDQPLCFGFGVMSQARERGHEHLLEGIKSLWSPDDVVFANLESVIDFDGNFGGRDFDELINRGAPSAAAVLESAGVDVVSLSNNHILEHGPEALLSTQKLLSDRSINFVGAGSSRTAVIDRGGARIGFTAWSLVPDMYNERSKAREHYNLAQDSSEICEAVLALRKAADHVIVSLHWGNEFVDTPSPEQVALAHAIIDAGADIIAGHHPHVLQPIERYRHGLIIYSLGNLVFDYWIAECRASAIVAVDLSRPMAYQAYPIFIDNEYAPQLLDDASTVMQRLEAPVNANNEIYRQVVYRKRMAYRRSALGHVLVSAARFRYRQRLKVMRWLMRRVAHVISILGKEKRDPNLVYGQSSRTSQ
jgi:poly-gamma-glutamate synthesis protein (capsule biosynthesis protein)